MKAVSADKDLLRITGTHGQQREDPLLRITRQELQEEDLLPMTSHGLPEGALQMLKAVPPAGVLPKVYRQDVQHIRVKTPEAAEKTKIP